MNTKETALGTKYDLARPVHKTVCSAVYARNTSIDQCEISTKAGSEALWHIGAILKSFCPKMSVTQQGT